MMKYPRVLQCTYIHVCLFFWKMFLGSWNGKKKKIKNWGWGGGGRFCGVWGHVTPHLGVTLGWKTNGTPCRSKVIVRKSWRRKKTWISSRKCPYMTGVPTWQDWCPFMTGVLTWQVSLCDRCPYTTGVPTWHDRYPYTTGVHTWQVSLHHRCPYTTGVPTWHDRYPYTTGVPTWQMTLCDRCPYMRGVPTSQVSLHHKCAFTMFTTESLICTKQNSDNRERSDGILSSSHRSVTWIH